MEFTLLASLAAEIYRYKQIESLPLYKLLPQTAAISLGCSQTVSRPFLVLWLTELTLFVAMVQDTHHSFPACLPCDCQLGGQKDAFAGRCFIRPVCGSNESRRSLFPSWTSLSLDCTYFKYCNPGNFRKRLIFVLFVSYWNLWKLIAY